MTIEDLLEVYYGDVEILQNWNNDLRFEGRSLDVPEFLLNIKIVLIDPCCAASDYNWLRIYI